MRFALAAPCSLPLLSVSLSGILSLGLAISSGTFAFALTLSSCRVGALPRSLLLSAARFVDGSCVGCYRKLISERRHIGFD